MKTDLVEWPRSVQMINFKEPMSALSGDVLEVEHLAGGQVAVVLVRASGFREAVKSSVSRVAWKPESWRPK